MKQKPSKFPILKVKLSISSKEFIHNVRYILPNPSKHIQIDTQMRIKIDFTLNVFKRKKM